MLRSGGHIGEPRATQWATPPNGEMNRRLASCSAVGSRRLPAGKIGNSPPELLACQQTACWAGRLSWSSGPQDRVRRDVEILGGFLRAEAARRASGLTRSRASMAAEGLRQRRRAAQALRTLGFLHRGAEWLAPVILPRRAAPTPEGKNPVSGPGLSVAGRRSLIDSNPDSPTRRTAYSSGAPVDGESSPLPSSPPPKNRLAFSE